MTREDVFGTVAGPRAARAVAVVTSVLGFAIYWLTLLPGVSFQDWAEAQFMPATLGVHHSTGYPLYTLVGWAWSLLPLGTLAYRANLLSALTVALSLGVIVLILYRLDVRPVLAGIAAMATGLAGTVWMESTTAAMNGLHLLLIALVLHRLLVWRDELRPRDLWLAGLLAGLALSNHRLAITALPVLAAYALWVGRSDGRVLVRGVAGGVLLFIVGLAPHLFIPIRAAFGPPEQYATLTTWPGFWYLVSGQQHAGGFSFFSASAVTEVAAALPDLVDLAIRRWNVVALVLSVAGIVVLLRWHGAVGLATAGLGLTAVFVYVNYLGAREQYLLVAWLVAGLWLGVALEGLVRALPRWFAWVGVGAVVLPVWLLASGWAYADQRDNRDGEAFARSVFSQLPQGSAVITYWDALNTLSYQACIANERPDVAVLSRDRAVRTACRAPTESFEDMVKHRPTYLLSLGQSDVSYFSSTFDLVRVARVRVPSDRALDYPRDLYRLVPKQAGG